MKQLKSFDEKAQERYKHKGRTYSVVNLTVPPLEADGSRAGKRFTELMTEHYAPFIYELADMTNGKIVIVGRYTDVEKAKDEILMRGSVSDGSSQ